MNKIKQNKLFLKLFTLVIVFLFFTSASNALTIKKSNTDQDKIGEIIIDQNKAECTGEGIKVYTTNITITMPETIEIPGVGEFPLPDWIAGKNVEITDVTWREKITRVNSSYELYVEYDADAPKFLILDLAVVLIYDLDLNMTFDELLEIINGNYSFLIDQLKDPTLTKVTIDEIDGRWNTFVDMSSKRIFTDTYVIVGIYIDFEEQKIHRDAEIITYQAIFKKSRDKTMEKQSVFNNFKFFYSSLLSKIISTVQRATLPETSGHLSLWPSIFSNSL